MYFADDIVVNDPLTICDFLEMVFLLMSSGLEAIIPFVSANFSGLSHEGALFFCAWLLLISPNLDGWVA